MIPEKDRVKIQEMLDLVTNDAGTGSAVKSLVAASSGILLAERQLTEMIKILDNHEEVGRMMKSAVEALEMATSRLQKVYQRFIALEVDRIKLSHRIHYDVGDVEPSCVICESLTTGKPATQDIGNVARVQVSAP